MVTIKAILDETGSEIRMVVMETKVASILKTPNIPIIK